MKTPVLYGPDGSGIDFSSAADRAALGEQLATRRNALGGFDLGAALGWLPDPDPVLRKRGDSVHVLEDLMADDEVTQAIQSRKLKTLNRREYRFSPGAANGEEPTAQAERLCDDIVRDFEQLDMDVLISGILDAPYFGMTPIELVFVPDGGRLRLVAADPKPVEWFAFDDDNRLMFRGEFFTQARPVHPYKFVLAHHFPTYKNPYGLRLLSRCLWPVAFKRGGIEFWCRFTEKYGQPWLLGTARAGATQPEINRMAADLAAMVQDAVAVVPNGAKVEAVEFSAKGGSQHLEFITHWDKSINKVIKGQTLTSDVGNGHSNAATQTHYQLLGDYSDADALMVETAMNNIAWAYMQVNAAGEFAPLFGYVEPDDYAAQAELDTKLKNLGVRFKKTYFVRTYDLTEDEFELDGEPEDAPNHKEPNATAAGDTNFAEHDTAGNPDPYQQALDAFVKTSLPEAAKRNEKFMAEVKTVLQAAESWEDLQLMLAELLGKSMDEDEQAAFMGDLLTNADLFGRYAMQSKSDDR
jgi:phage gp29-like protein